MPIPPIRVSKNTINFTDMIRGIPERIKMLEIISGTGGKKLYIGEPYPPSRLDDHRTGNPPIFSE
jgi:hypothetical protein